MFKKKQLVAYRHSGFWQCVDTKRDLDLVKENIKKFENKILIIGGTGFIGYHLAKKGFPVCEKKNGMFSTRFSTLNQKN